MKILQVNTEKTWRGGERQTLYLLKAFKQKGHSVALLTLKNSPLHINAMKNNIKVFAINSYLSALLKLFFLVKKFDIINAQTGKAHTQCFLIKIIINFKLIYTRRVDFIPRGRLTKYKYLKTDLVVSISKSISKILNKSEIVANSPVIYSSFVPKRLNNKRAENLLLKLKIPREKKIIGLISALEPHKDPQTAIKVCSELNKKSYDYIFLHFGDGSLFKDIKEEINLHGLQKKYLLMGHLDSVEDFFSIFDFFLMTSTEEGLGSSVLDAFYYKVPVVSTDAGGLKELVLNRGLLSEKGNALGLAKNIQKLRKDKKIREKNTSSAYEYCIQKHNITNAIKQYEKLFLKA